MNEQIKEIAVKAKLEHCVSHVRLEDFANLIIQECVTTILKESKWYWDKDEFESSNAIQNAARRLTEHFGVKE